MLRTTFGTKIHGKHGQISVPSRGPAIVGGAVAVIFGGFWTLFTSFIFPPFALFGLLFIGLGLWSSISHFGRAEQYQRLRTRHESKRQELTQRLQSRG